MRVVRSRGHCVLQDGLLPATAFHILVPQGGLLPATACHGLVPSDGVLPPAASYSLVPQDVHLKVDPKTLKP